MIRTSLIILAIGLSTVCWGQKPQRIAYIDMEYILENVPEYAEAQARLNQRVQGWQRKLDDLQREIEILKTDLGNEKPLLTADLIAEREEEIEIKEVDLKNLQASYFGPTGDLYLLRKQLVKPVQDQIYNAVQEIAVRRKYDMILDKSSDLIMLYTNKKFDVSDQVLNRIVKGRKAKAVEEKREARQEAASQAEENAEVKAADKTSKREALQARIAAQNAEKAKKREALKKAADERRQKRLEEIERRKNEREAKAKGLQPTAKTGDSTQTKQAVKKLPSRVKDTVALKKLDSAKAAKRAALLERARLAKEAKEKKRQELIKAREERRKKRLAEIEKRKKKKEEETKENNN